jgi:hypothetical protein
MPRDEVEDLGAEGDGDGAFSHTDHHSAYPGTFADERSTM